MRTNKYMTVAPSEVLGGLSEVEKKFAPAQLFLAGRAELLRGTSRVSIVGSRKATDDGLKRARALARKLVEHGIVVVSGLAAGVDRAAHEAAIEAAGETIGVLGTPLDESYPKENAELQRRIAREFLLVSQFPPGYPVQPKNFPIRNRTMALLTDATIIVEAGERSGTLHQGWEALRLGRPLFILESVASSDALTWPAEMTQYGAQILSRDNLDVIVENLASAPFEGALAAEA
jgi:DNA processing protein